jgi:hypothetical protein
MKSRCTTLLTLAVLVGPLVTMVRADISAEQVHKAIQEGVAYLEGMQHADGGWDDFPGYSGGVSALCTLALLNAGVEATDPNDLHVARALRKLAKPPAPTMTYSRSLQTMAFCRAGAVDYLSQIERNADWLQKAQLTEGPNRGAWSYADHESSLQGNGDNSNSQFALLALYEAQRAFDAAHANVHVNDRTWRLAKAYWEGCQNLDGSWGYYKDQPGTGSMTCAGITSLIIAGDMVHQADAKADGDHIQCCGQGDVENDRIEQGVNWLGRHFTVTGNPGAVGRGFWWLYYLYGVERVGRLTARRFIGGHDWYREGADHLIRQHGNMSDGGWIGPGHAEENPTIGTSLALLFLSKGRRPVLLAKLRHGPGQDWNQHRNDVSNLTAYVETKWQRDLTWQVIDLAGASVDDLLQAPVLYLCGDQSPLPEDPQQQRHLAQKLRDYLDRGGFLFAEGYCGGDGFHRGFRELMARVFANEPEYRLRLLDSAHPIWHAEEKVATEQLRPLLGIEFGCRTSVVYAPPDPPRDPRPSLSCLWELSRSGRQQQFTPAVQAQIDAARAIGINVLAYATNREVKWKDEQPATTTVSELRDRIERGKISIAKLRHPGGCDAAPRALANLMEAAARELKIRVDLHPTLLNITDDALFDYHLVFMHGRNSFHLTDHERAALKTYVERGGMILADSICANRAFTESFCREMAAIFPDRPLERIPADDPLLGTTYGGFDLSKVSRRDPQPSGAGGPLSVVVRHVPPDLRGIKLGEHYGVIFSPFDLSCALEKLDSLECQGYKREDAARIGLNVLLYSLQQ